MNICDPQNLLSTVVCKLMLTLWSVGWNTTKVETPSRLEYQLIQYNALPYINRGQWAPS